jgi:hypothetical protein
MTDPCDACESSTHFGSCFVELSDCGHKICLICFKNCWTRKFVNVCPRKDCKLTVKASTMVHVDSLENSERGQETAHRDLDQGLDALRLWKDREEFSSPGQSIIASASWTGPNNYTFYSFKTNLQQPHDEESDNKTVKLFARVPTAPPPV